MKRAFVSNFARGMADDRFDARADEYSFAKHFDILTHPKRLQPLRGMTADTAGTGIGNMLTGSNGLMFALGEDPDNPGNGELWRRSGYGGSDVWARLTTHQLSGATAVKDFLVENPDAGQIRSMYWASNNLLCASDPAGGSAASTNALTFASIGQGLVHPKDKILYFPYKTTSAFYIGLLAPNGSAFGGLAATAFQPSFLYRAYCLSYYGDFLAIPMTSVQGIGVNGSLVGLWSRDVSTTVFSETIPWGQGSLQVLNNVNGVLVGINTLSANFTGSVQDFDEIEIKVWAGGAEPTLVKQIKAIHLAGSSHPVVTINPRVNFVYNNRLYFSINVNPNDGKQQAWYGLWSVGKNTVTGEWTVTLERMATNGGTETGVIAAAMSGDFCAMCHTSEGTLVYTINGNTSNTSYAATSVYESGVNPGMDAEDRILKKKLHSVTIPTLPIPVGAQVSVRYRVDSDGNTADWQTLKTATTTGAVQVVAVNKAGTPMKSGYNYEFQLQSTGGAVILPFMYKYAILETNA